MMVIGNVLWAATENLDSFFGMHIVMSISIMMQREAFPFMLPLMLSFILLDFFTTIISTQETFPRDDHK